MRSPGSTWKALIEWGHANRIDWLIGGFYAYDNRMRTTKIDADCSATTDAQGQFRFDFLPLGAG